LSQRGTFNATYNPAVTGSVPLPFFDKMPGAGLLTNATVSGLIRGGEAGSLAQTYQGALLFPHAGFSFFPNPYVLYSSLLTNFGNSTYNAMQLEIRRTTRAGIQFQANYTWSKSLSDALLTRGLDPVLDNNNPKIEKARTPFDVTHSFKVNYSAALPFGSDKKFHFRRNGVLDRITGGWIMSGFLHIDSGPPFSILSGLGTLNRGARSGQNTVDTTANLDTLRQATGLFMTGNGPYLVDPSHVGSDGRGVAPDGAAPFAGQLFFKPQPGSLGSLQRRILSGPTYWNYNFAVIKETKLFENHLIQFRADFYNIFNHPNFFAGDQTITSSSFGKITSTLTSGENVNRRTIQFGLTYKF